MMNGARQIGRPHAAIGAAAVGVFGALLLASPARAADHPAAAGVVIELRAEAAVATPQVRLGDVAALTTVDRELLERLMALPLGPVPRTGTVVRLDRAALLRWVRARVGLREDEISWMGSRETAVRAAVGVVSGRRIAARASEALTEAVEACGLRVDHLTPELPADVDVLAGTVELSAQPVARMTLAARRPVVWVDVRVDGRWVRAVPVTFDLRAVGPAYVAVAKRAPGDAMDAETVEVREVRWNGADVLPVGGEGPPLRFRRPVDVGSVVTTSHVEPTPAVRRGGWATLRGGAGLVTLEQRVEVLQDARAGQVVRVRPAGGRGTLLARVTGAGSLEVEQ